MAKDENNHPEQFDASLPLPIKHGSGKKQPDTKGEDPAADIIRKRVDAAYQLEPSVSEEAVDLRSVGGISKRSKHQQFITELTASGKPLHEIQVAWHEYYAGLSEAEKHEVWQEFYASHAQAAHYHTALTEALPTRPARSRITRYRSPTTPAGKAMAGAKRQITRALPAKTASGAPHPLRSLVFGLGVGAVVIIVFLFSFFNERFIAPFIQPSRNVTSTPIISSAGVIGPDPEIIIPKINVEIPVVYTVDTIDDNAVENALEQGVVHYADTALPGQDGNIAIVGHSSNNIFNPGKYKFAFVLLSKLENGDTFYLQKDGKRYTYQVYKKEIVSPTDVSVLGPADKPATATLITCDPPGTSTNRLVVVGEQIDPSIASNTAQTATGHLATTTAIIPGNSPTLWSRLVKWLEQ